MAGEFSIITQYFSRYFSDALVQATNPYITRGIGDDAAVLSVPVNHELVTSVDTLVTGVHFPKDTPAADIAYKALAVNLSDLAAMGASPAGFTLSLTLPDYNVEWLEGFSKGLVECAGQFAIPLIGGDTTKGPLAVSIQILGYVPVGEALYRRGAAAGDLVLVSGVLGDAGAGLKEWFAGEREAGCLIQRLLRPTPRLELGLALRGIASSCLDISDGLLADVEHLINANSTPLAVKLQLDSLPMSSALRASGANPEVMALTAGDDYELCFTVPKNKIAELGELQVDIELTQVGVVVEGAGVSCYQGDKLMRFDGMAKGYNHFVESIE